MRRNATVDALIAVDTPPQPAGSVSPVDPVSPPAEPALLVLAEPTVAVANAPDANAATPSEPDTPLALRTYVVEDGDSVRTIARQFGVTNETIIWENDLTDPDALS